MEIGFDSSDIISGASKTFKTHLRRNSKLRLAVAHAKELLETATVFEWGFSAARMPKSNTELYSEVYEDEDYMDEIESVSVNLTSDYRITLKLGITHAFTDTGCHEISVKTPELLVCGDDFIFATMPAGVNDKIAPNFDKINYGIQKGKLLEIAAKDPLLVVEGSFRFWAKEVDDMMVVQFSDYKKRIAAQIQEIVNTPEFPAIYETYFLEKFRKKIESQLNPLKRYSPDIIHRVLNEMYVKDVVNT